MSDSRAVDEAAIQAVMAESYEAWRTGDAAGMVADYTEDASAIMPGGIRDGREAIRKSMAEGFASFLKDTSTYNEQLSIRFLGDDAAILVTESAILFPGQTEITEDGKVNCTWVLEKRDGQWLIAAYHNSPATAPTP
jgi:uncharacterized protein (TIGR02246 family)